jgi:hypothetical protein
MSKHHCEQKAIPDGVLLIWEADQTKEAWNER